MNQTGYFLFIIYHSSFIIRYNESVNPVETSGTVRSASRYWLLAICGLLLVGLWLAQAHPYLNVANDSGRYMTLGKSLAETGELRLSNEAKRPFDTLYPPGFPALIAFWLRATDSPPGGIVWPVKITQLLFLLAALPLLLRLLECARLPFRYCVAALVTAACCPAFASYANEVMSEAPFLTLCLASIVLVTPDLRVPPEEEKIPVWRRGVSLLAAVGAFFTRTAGIALLGTLVVWFWRRFGWKWSIIAAGVTLCVAGGWQIRNRRIMAHPPPGVHYSSYTEQFSLRDPMRPGAGRIPMTVSGIWSRIQAGFPTYIGMIPRTLLHSMSRHSRFWFVFFYILAVPMALLMLFGWGLAWKRGVTLSAGFAALFWVFAALWPWRDPRFLVPLLPYFILFLFLGLEWVAERGREHIGERAVPVLETGFAALLLIYFLQVHLTIIHRERRPVAAGYAFGRSPEEGGFYAACEWLRANTPADNVVMGRPAYHVYLYCDRVVTQIEPHTNPRVQERAYMRSHNVRYLLEDTWSWSNTEKYIGPYLQEYGHCWKKVWEDVHGSEVTIWERVTPYEETPANESPQDSLQHSDAGNKIETPVQVTGSYRAK